MDTEHCSYRTTLYNTSDTLLQITNQLYTCLFNVAMTGELSELNDLLKPGDSLDLRETDLRGLEDRNAKSIITILDFLMISRENFMSDNYLEEN